MFPVVIATGVMYPISEEGWHTCVFTLSVHRLRHMLWNNAYHTGSETPGLTYP